MFNLAEITQNKNYVEITQKLQDRFSFSTSNFIILAFILKFQCLVFQRSSVPLQKNLSPTVEIYLMKHQVPMRVNAQCHSRSSTVV